MPRRSFSFQGLDQLLSATEAQNQALAQAASAPRYIHMQVLLTGNIFMRPSAARSLREKVHSFALFLHYQGMSWVVLLKDAQYALSSALCTGCTTGFSLI